MTALLESAGFHLAMSQSAAFPRRVPQPVLSGGCRAGAQHLPLSSSSLPKAGARILPTHAHPYLNIRIPAMVAILKNSKCPRDRDVDAPFSLPCDT